MFASNTNPDESGPKWLHPNEVLKLQRLKLKKKQLQARINKTNKKTSASSSTDNTYIAGVSEGLKRKNPFIKTQDNKRTKPNTPDCDESSDQTLFRLFHVSEASTSANSSQPTSFANVLTVIQDNTEKPRVIAAGKPWIPIDWTLKSKVRLMSSKAFAWNQKLKISEEASGITGFARCLDNNSETTLDTSPNARFHQCCLYWQHPNLPWLNLFPRTQGRVSMGASFASTAAIRESLQRAWSDSLRSLYQLVRTRQCPYFYMCTNTFTALFRAPGICGNTEIIALITPSTSGFRQLLKQEDIEYKMPLKTRRTSDQGYDTLDSTSDTTELAEEPPDEEWLQSMGLNAEDIKQINYTQAKIAHRTECEIDNSAQSLLLIEGMEVNALYNFLINCKSVTSTTGPLAGIPPTLLAPIAFHGATLSSLKVRESKVRGEGVDYFSLEISGPILPHVIHNLCDLHPSDQNLTATFANVSPTLPFSKVEVKTEDEKENVKSSGFVVFDQANLSDCGLNRKVLKHFCSSNVEHVQNVECLKYSTDTKTYAWS